MAAHRTTAQALSRTRCFRWSLVACLTAILLPCAVAADESPAAGAQESDLSLPERELRALEARGIRANPFRAGRSMTLSENGIVASEHYLASLAGLDILRRGGSAVDAAIAAMATMSVVSPMMTGPGGDVFLLYYEAKTGKIYALNGSGHAPQALTLDYFQRNNKRSINGRSWEAVTVPGAVDAWCEAHRRFGRKPLAEVLAPAILHAEEGVPVTEVVALAWNAYGGALTKDRFARETYLVDGKPPAVGTVFRNPRLGASLRLIAGGGADAFYRGPIAQEIVRYSQETGGFLSLDDFSAHRSTWVEPIHTNYRGYEVYQCPPNGQGIAVLLMLNILEGFDLPGMEFDSPEYLHLLIEAKKLAYADLHRYVADPERAKVPVAELLSKEYAKGQRERIDRARAGENVEPGVVTGNDTTYLTAIDSAGNAVSLINSLSSAFGSGIVGGSTGILLQDRGAGFSLDPDHPNHLEPGKRPFHTIIPGMVTKDGKLYLSYGLMGGPMQPQGHVQFLLAHLDHGLTIQEAIDVPRWRHMSGTRVRLEHGMPRATADALRSMGHVVDPANLSDFGSSQAILVDPKSGLFFGASDPRRDGAAMGY